MLFNILQISIEEEIKKEDLMILTEETNKKLKELEEKIKVHKQDLDYLSSEVNKRIDEDFK